VLSIVVMSFGFGFLYGNFTYSFLISGASLVYPAIMLLRQREQLRRWKEEKEKIQQASGLSGDHAAATAGATP